MLLSCQNICKSGSVFYISESADVWGWLSSYPPWPQMEKTPKWKRWNIRIGSIFHLIMQYILPHCSLKSLCSKEPSERCSSGGRTIFKHIFIVLFYFLSLAFIQHSAIALLYPYSACKSFVWKYDNALNSSCAFSVINLCWSCSENLI